MLRGLVVACLFAATAAFDGKVAGTEWYWNKWQNVQFHHDGEFSAPSPECDGSNPGQRCRWTQQGSTVRINWGNAGLHTVFVAGKQINGKRDADGQNCEATYVRRLRRRSSPGLMDMFIFGLGGKDSMLGAPLHSVDVFFGTYADTGELLDLAKTEAIKISEWYGEIWTGFTQKGLHRTIYKQATETADIAYKKAFDPKMNQGSAFAAFVIVVFLALHVVFQVTIVILSRGAVAWGVL